eukprot:Tamp_24494.p1 GENE.Tamp_24494~~Tamp_24494.p1  ORF type:complete len:320 (+),score=28.89 Tamp_24494:32-961(+)
MPGPKVQLTESSVAGVASVLPAFVRQMAVSLREAGPYSWLSMGAAALLARRIVLRQDPLQLDGKFVVVNNATSRLGCSVCAQLLRRGAHVIMVGPKNRPIEGFLTQIRGEVGCCAALLLGRECDCRDGKAVEAMVRDITATIGAPDIIIHLVQGASRSLTELSYQQVRDDFEDLVLPLAYLSRSCLRTLLFKGQGSIVLVQSAVSRGQWQDSTILMTAGWGLRGLVGALTADLRGTGVTVQEVVLPVQDDERSATSRETATVQNAATIVSALQNRQPLTFAGVERYNLDAAYPLLFHAFLLSLLRHVQR